MVIVPCRGQGSAYKRVALMNCVWRGKQQSFSICKPLTYGTIHFSRNQCHSHPKSSLGLLKRSYPVVICLRLPLDKRSHLCGTDEDDC